MLTNIIPAAWRQRVYAAYALIIVALGATQVGYVTAKFDQPTWLIIAFSVAGYLGVAIGALAASNITTVPAPVPMTVTVNTSTPTPVTPEALYAQLRSQNATAPVPSVPADGTPPTTTLS